MGLGNLVRSKGFKNFMSKLYGWGASVVILGALFKINHYPGADIMLIIGLGTESLIFFFSGFEPPFVDPDWSLVYPELAGLYRETEIDNVLLKKGKPTEELDDMLAEAKIDQKLIDNLGKGLRNLSSSTSQLSDITEAASATSDYIDNIKSASKGAGELSESYVKTSESLNKDKEAVDKHYSNLKDAAENVSGLSSVYSEASATLKSNLSAADEFSNSVKEASLSANALAQKYNESAAKIQESAENLNLTGSEAQQYNQQLKKTAENLSALNAIYELQLQGSNENVESNNKLQVTLNQFLNSLSGSIEKTSTYQEQMTALNDLYLKQLQGTDKQVVSTIRLQETLDKFLENLNASIEMTAKYKDGVDELAQNVAALNNVYGNMLSAMNVSKGK